MASTEKSTTATSPTQLDITIGEIRLVVSPLGLVGLHRGVMDEHITLVASEAVTIARVLLERLGGVWSDAKHHEHHYAGDGLCNCERQVINAPVGSAHTVAPDWRDE